MSNSVIRHYGTSRRDTPHVVITARCRLTMDPKRVTCPECLASRGVR